MSNRFGISSAWRIVLTDLDFSAFAILRRAGLPDDLFGRAEISLSTIEYFRFWDALQAESGDPKFPLRIGSAIPAEAFDPPVFAALCSPNLETALRRIATYKRLVSPMKMRVTSDWDTTTMSLQWLDRTIAPPASLVLFELVFFTQLARLATRHRVEPLRALVPCDPPAGAAWRDYFGVDIGHAEDPTLVFRRGDADRSFLTSNEAMWQYFEPQLRRRLTELDSTATAQDRVRACLLEVLPSGDASVRAVADRLAVSSRTLQRLLNQEGTSFKLLLQEVRHELALHYLKSPELSMAEISFLLGFDDPGSFSRAFVTWTGTNPEHARQKPEVVQA